MKRDEVLKIAILEFAETFGRGSPLPADLPGNPTPEQIDEHITLAEERGWLEVASDAPHVIVRLTDAGHDALQRYRETSGPAASPIGVKKDG